MDTSQAFEHYAWAKEELERQFPNAKVRQEYGEDMKELGLRVSKDSPARSVLITLQTPYFSLKDDEKGRARLAVEIEAARSKEG